MEPLRRLATYPFTSEAQRWVRESGPSLDELLKDRAYATARALGMKRLLRALEKERVWKAQFDTDPECINELLSYAVARIIASVVGDRYLIRRFALAEAERINKSLQEEELDFVIDICGNLGLEAELVVPRDENGRAISMHFLTFLRNTSQMRSIEWKLVNMEVKDGQVYLDQRRLCRIVQEVLRKQFEAELPRPVTPSIKEALEAEALEVIDMIAEKKKFLEPDGMGEVRADCFPPCIKHLLALAQAGENLSHMGRFTLASFLNTLGMGGEEILKVFASSPDFREDLASYQIDHITGKISGTVYTPPECTTMVSFGLCYEKDRLCDMEWLTHPLKYYRSRYRSLRRKKGGQGGATEGGGKKSEEE